MAKQKAEVFVSEFSNCIVYKHKNKRIKMYAPDENGSVHVFFKRLMVIEDKQDRAEIIDKSGLETKIIGRKNSKYIIIVTNINLSDISSECVHHGLSNYLKQ